MSKRTYKKVQNPTKKCVLGHTINKFLEEAPRTSYADGGRVLGVLKVVVLVSGVFRPQG